MAGSGWSSKGCEAVFSRSVQFVRVQVKHFPIADTTARARSCKYRCRMTATKAELHFHITDITYKGSGVASLLSKCEGVFPQPFWRPDLP